MGFQFCELPNCKPHADKPRTSGVVHRRARRDCGFQIGAAIHVMVAQEMLLSGLKIGSSQNYGYPFGGPYNNDYSILGSFLGSPYFGKLPSTTLLYSWNAVYLSIYEQQDWTNGFLLMVPILCCKTFPCPVARL